MPYQQQLAIWVLVLVAIISGVYSFASGKMFAQTSVPAQTSSQISQAPLPSPTKSPIEELADVMKPPTTSPTPSVSYERSCGSQNAILSSKIYQKGSSLRIDSTVFATAQTPLTKSTVLMLPKAAYAWNVSTKTGYVMPLSEQDGSSMISSDTLLSAFANQLGLTLEELMKTCRNETIADTLFTPPADVKFSDANTIKSDNQPAQEGDLNSLLQGQ